MTNPQTLVLGIGNILFSDEGAGIHVIRHLQKHHPLPHTVYLDGGTLSFTLTAPIGASDYLIVIDAATIGEAAGNFRVFLDSTMDSFLSKAKHSVHEVSLIDLISISRLTDSLPRKRALIGIQPAELGWGEQPSPPVTRTIPRAARQVLQLIQSWQGPTP
jgi:hydrogenase maturation protease